MLQINKNINTRIINLSSVPLQELNLSNNKFVEELYLDNIKRLNVSSCKGLTKIVVASKQLDFLDISNCVSLKEMNIEKVNTLNINFINLKHNIKLIPSFKESNLSKEPLYVKSDRIYDKRFFKIFKLCGFRPFATIKLLLSNDMYVYDNNTRKV